MPNYYYFVSYVYDEPEEDKTNITSCTRNRPKPRPINLVLPAAHAGRSRNFLLAAARDVTDPEEAVAAMLDSCEGATTWPSSEYRLDSADEIAKQQTRHSEDPYSRHTPSNDHVQSENQNGEVRSQPDVYNTPTEFQPTYGTVSETPDVLNAARALFFERKRQMALYGLYTPARPFASALCRMPSDYELFTAWACLPRAEKQSYIREVSLCISRGEGNALESRRAVDGLYKSCPDSLSWPSLQYLRVQEYLAQQLLVKQEN